MYGNGVNGASASSSRPMTAAEVQQRTEQLRELVQETIRITVSTGPRGIFRAMQAAQSVAGLAAEYLQAGAVDAPPVFLRKLFEKLGEFTLRSMRGPSIVAKDWPEL